jgi:hypothetical protein
MVSRALRVVLATLIVLCIPSAARAVTLDDIIALSKAGVSADVLVAVIDADRTVFTLNTEELVLLKKAGVPSSVIVKMLGTAREFVEVVPPPLIVGADRPKRHARHEVPSYAVQTYPGTPFLPVAPYYVVPYPVFVTPVTPGLAPNPVRGFGRFMNTGPGFGRFMDTGPGFGRFMNDGFVDPPRAPAK